MIIVARAPLRIPIGGGGTDLPSYYSLYGGEWISASIDKYIYIILNTRFKRNSLKLSYSETEETSDINNIRHPVFREVLKLLNINQGLDIFSAADIPSRTGLGSSGSFTVALLFALYNFLHDSNGIKIPSLREIVEQSCHITIDVLKQPSGKQDEYIAAYGGITSFVTSKNGRTSVKPLFSGRSSLKIIKELESNLLMFYTGIRRESSSALKYQVKATQKKEKEIIENLHKVKKIGQEIKKALLAGDFYRFGELMDEHWQNKIKREGTSNPQINRWYEIAKKNGAVGGKLMGAGGGGFFLFYCEKDKDKLRKAMNKLGFQEQPFHFVPEGVKIVARG